jgi:hypothetical protein
MRDSKHCWSISGLAGLGGSYLTGLARQNSSQYNDKLMKINGNKIQKK